MIERNQFSGDPGSIYLVFCDPNCKDSDGIVNGTNIYDENTPICKAGIHSGIIDNKGGFMTVKITHAHKNFLDSTILGINS